MVPYQDVARMQPRELNNVTKRRRRSSHRPPHDSVENRRSERPAPPGHVARRKLVVALLPMLSVVLLSFSFAPFGVWPLAYIALVPWGVALLDKQCPRWSLLWATVGGTLFWAANLYWLWWITLIGYAALLVYLTAYWLVAGVVVRGAVRRGLPVWLVLPVVWVALEYARAYVISGFPWFFLAHSQYAQTRLIQITDTLGQYGVSFFVAMVNGLLIDLATGRLFVADMAPRRLARRVVAGAIVCVTALGGLLGYGTWRVNQDTLSEGPVVGIVQQAFRSSLGGRSAPPDKIFHDHAEATGALLDSDSDLVLWPETMLPPGLNPEFLTADFDAMSEAELRSLTSNFVHLPEEERFQRRFYTYVLETYRDGGRIGGEGRPVIGRREYAEKVAELSRKLDAPLLAGGVTLHANPRPIDDYDLWVPRNSVLWFDRDPLAQATYSKRHLVPLSEYVPYKHSWTWLHEQLRRFVPPVMHQLDPGPEVVRFGLKSNEGQEFRLAVPICYEGTFARICRDMVIEDGRKKVDILANLSNDGWFVYSWRDGPLRGSTEQPQHMVQYVFRAVETRTPVVRAVNTGISASINPNGRIEAVLEKYGSATMVRGTLLLDGKENDEHGDPVRGPKVLVDSRVSMYSLIGDVFAQAVSAAAGVMAIWLLWKKLQLRKGLKH